MHQNLFPKKQLSILVASLSLLSALPAEALVIDNLTAQTSARAGGNVAVTDGPSSSDRFTFVSSSSNDSPSQALALSFGSSAGAYGAGGSGSGVFDSTGQFLRQWNITNDSGVAQNYRFNFLIYGGGMSASDYGAGGDGYSEYMVNIRQDGLALFSSSAKLESNGSLTTSGTTLTGATLFGSSYNWGGTYLTLDLGILNNGDTTSVAYDLIGHAFGNYDFATTTTTGDCGDGGDSDIGFFPDGPRSPDVPRSPEVSGSPCAMTVTVTGSSNVFLGDPDSLNSTPITSMAVPEPTTLALFGLGLAALGLRRRYRI